MQPVIAMLNPDDKDIMERLHSKGLVPQEFVDAFDSDGTLFLTEPIEEGETEFFPSYDPIMKILIMVYGKLVDGETLHSPPVLLPIKPLSVIYGGPESGIVN